MVIYSKTRITNGYNIKLRYLFYNDVEMSVSPSNHHKINKMLQKYNDDSVLDLIVCSVQDTTDLNRKKCIKDCKEMIQTVQDTNSKKYIKTLRLLQDEEFGHIVEKYSEKKVTSQPIRTIHTFDDWLLEQIELRSFMNTSDTYSQGEQVYHGKRLIEEYTKYTNQCIRNTIIPTPFPNIEIMNRMCESITLETGRIIKNPNYMPHHEHSIWSCCFT